MNKYLHKRIVENCLKLFEQAHYRAAAQIAMSEVELAFKEKAGEKRLYGQKLIESYLGDKSNTVKLNVFNEDLQKDAEMLFKASFGYYRNYCAHDGRKIDERSCARILFIASDILELIGASVKSFTRLGGVDGLIKSGTFDSFERVEELLKFLSCQQFHNEVYDEMFEELYINRHFTEEQYIAVFELGLVAYNEKIENDEKIENNSRLISISYGWLELTMLGEQVLKSVQR